MMTLYGIKNCDTCHKALAWLSEQNIAHEFHDYKKAGLPMARFVQWATQLPADRLINRKGTSWRKLSPAQQQMLDDLTTSKAQALLQDNTSLIKRPLIEANGAIYLGFDDGVRAALMG